MFSCTDGLSFSERKRGETRENAVFELGGTVQRSAQAFTW